MHPAKFIDLHAKASVRGLMLTQFPDDFPYLREIKIQNGKLMRMLINEVKLFGARSVLSRSPKKLAKERGEYVARIGKQAKLVEDLLFKGFKEGFRAHGKPATNAQFQEFRAVFQRDFNKWAQDFKQKAIAEVAGMGLTPKK